MSYSIKFKKRAINLRKRGFSLKEISKKLSIAKSTASEWVSEIELSPTAQNRLAKKQILGQYKTVLIKRQLRDLQNKRLEKNSLEILKGIILSKDLAKVLCALLWWCEGNKITSFVRFTNSDPTLIKNFLFLLRFGFKIDEEKFRALVHIHSYHNDDVQRKFWSTITRISLIQFNKSYKKLNSGIRIQENYPGCIAITYYDAKVAKELKAIYNAFSQYRGVR